MLSTHHVFSIENLTNPETKQPFGPKYAGAFNIRRATLFDRELSERKEVAERNAFGFVPASEISPNLSFSSEIFCTIGTIATEELPPWFDRSKLYEEDEPAVVAVWNEVQKFLDSFRRPKSGTDGEGAGGESTVLVPPEVSVA